MHVVRLAQAGVPVHRRFSFYDQIHTTGMDIHQCIDARAAITLGKDMTFRGEPASIDINFVFRRVVTLTGLCLPLFRQRLCTRSIQNERHRARPNP